MIAFSSSEPEPAAFEQLLPPEGKNQQWRPGMNPGQEVRIKFQ